MIQTFPFIDGFALLIGLSTDSKPINPANNLTFLETDTGKIFRITNGVWSESVNAVYHPVAANLVISGLDLVTDTSTGTKIGTATTQKLGFFNATPIVRGAAFAQTYSTASHTQSNLTSADFPAGGTGAAAGGWSTAANRDLAITRFNALRVDVANIKQVLNGLIDDLQALGLIG
jgi:hypothetical protein